MRPRLCPEPRKCRVPRPRGCRRRESAERARPGLERQERGPAPPRPEGSRGRSGHSRGQRRQRPPAVVRRVRWCGRRRGRGRSAAQVTRGTRARGTRRAALPLSPRWGLNTAERAGSGGGAACAPGLGVARPLRGPAAVSAAVPARPPAADRQLLSRRRPRSERPFSRSSPPGPRGEPGGARSPGRCAAAAGLRPQRLIRPGPACGNKVSRVKLEPATCCSIF